VNGRPPSHAAGRRGRYKAADLHDRREAERIDLLGALQGEVMVFQPTTITQIGTGGIEVETAFPLQLDSLHDFRLTLSELSLVIKGRVVHSSISDVDQDTIIYRSGIEFVEPPDRVISAIGQFLEAVRPFRL
jgi:hypothetical protein